MTSTQCSRKSMYTYSFLKKRKIMRRMTIVMGNTPICLHISIIMRMREWRYSSKRRDHNRCERWKCFTLKKPMWAMIYILMHVGWLSVHANTSRVCGTYFVLLPEKIFEKTYWIVTGESCCVGREKFDDPIVEYKCCLYDGWF